MADERAVLLVNLLGEYLLASVAEGMTLDEVKELTVGEVVTDCVDTTPRHLNHTLSAAGRKLAA